MYAVIFEVTPNPAKGDEYFELAQAMRDEVESIDGFISIERFQSVADENRFVSLSFWRDEEAIKAWRENINHRNAQEKGKDGIFKDFRIRVAKIERDYCMADRA